MYKPIKQLNNPIKIKELKKKISSQNIYRLNLVKTIDCNKRKKKETEKDRDQIKSYHYHITSHLIK